MSNHLNSGDIEVKYGNLHPDNINDSYGNDYTISKIIIGICYGTKSKINSIKLSDLPLSLIIPNTLLKIINSDEIKFLSYKTITYRINPITNIKYKIIIENCYTNILSDSKYGNFYPITYQKVYPPSCQKIGQT